MHDTPVSNFEDSGKPAWMEIRAIFEAHDHPPPQQAMLDELAGMLAWARFGKASAQIQRQDAALVASAIKGTHYET